MRKLWIVVGLFVALSMVGAVQAPDIQVNYCTEITANDTYISVLEDIYFNNSSAAYNYACFRPSGAGAVSYSNVTIDLNGSTIFINNTLIADGVTIQAAMNWTVRDGIFNYTGHTSSGTGIHGQSTDNENILIENVQVVAGARYGLFIVDGTKGLQVYNSTFTGSTNYDINLKLPQSEITSCENTYNTFYATGSLLSKDLCTDPPAEYRDYIYETNCTQHSSTAYGSLVCSNEFPIPADCVNITTEAWTVISVNNEEYMNVNTSFTRWTCNPEGDRTTHCDNLYRTCEYYNLNAYPKRRWDDYAAGGNATSFHIVTLPYGCMENVTGGNFTMIGRLHLACKSFTESGIIIDGESEECEHGMYCFNSNTMEERFADCTSIHTPCVYGCVEGVCLPVSTTTLPSGEGTGTLIDLSPYTAASWISMLFTPFSIITMMLVGVGAYFESSVKDAKGGIFLAVIIIGTLGFTYLGIYPAFIGILIAIVCAGILSKFVLQLW